MTGTITSHMIKGRRILLPGYQTVEEKKKELEKFEFWPDLADYYVEQLEEARKAAASRRRRFGW